MLPNRKDIRLKDYDYSQDGYYFITICVQGRQCLFGEVVNGEMIENQYGTLINDFISKISDIYSNVKVECKVVMPNHIHFILAFVGVAYHATRDTDNSLTEQRAKMLLPKIIQQFKAATTKKIKLLGGLHDMQPLQWQRNYYEHIIRNEQDYQNIYEYIKNNPDKWKDDKYYIN